MAAAVGDIYRVAAVGVYAGQQIMLTHHYAITQLTGPGTDATIRTMILDTIRGGVGGGNTLEGPYLACLPPQYDLSYWVAQKIAPTRLRYEVYARNTPGTHANDTETGNQAAVITLETEAAGRNQVCNKHIGPIPQDPVTQDNGLVTAAYAATLDNLRTALLAGLVSVGLGVTLEPCIYHRANPNTPSYLETGYVQTTLRVMRRRTVGFGK